MSPTWVLLFAGLIPLVFSPPAEARQWCTNADFAGLYTFSGAGSVLFAPPDRPIVGPFTRLGRLVSFGDGRMVLPHSLSTYVGIAYRSAFDGSYSVNSDCTIDFILNAPAPVGLPVSFSGILTDNNQEVRLVTTAPGGLLFGTVRRQRVYGCSVGDLAGAFLFEMSGNLVAPLAPAPVSVLGLLVASGSGTFTSRNHVNLGGLSFVDSVSGDYAVDFDCNVTLKYTSTTPLGPLNVVVERVLTDHNSAAIITTGPPGVALSGVLRRQ